MRTKRFYISLFLCLVLFFSPAFSITNFSVSNIYALGTSYYVDATLGNDSNSGTDSTHPWQTLSKINNSTFSPGDQILLKRGEVWREQLTIPSSGSFGNPITISAYGSGNKPKILGSNVVTGWSQTTPPTATLFAPLSSNLSLSLGSGSPTFSRSSTATYIDSGTGLLTTSSSGTARFENFGSRSSLLLEPSSTNLFLNSSAVNTWATGQASVSGSPIVGPDGVTSNAYGIIPSTSNSNAHYVGETDSAPVVAGQKYTASAYVKPGVSNYVNIQVVWLTSSFGYLGSTYAFYNLSNGSSTSGDDNGNTASSTMTAAVNGFRRIHLSAIAPAGAELGAVLFNVEPTDGSSSSFSGNGTSVYAYITHAQFEQSFVPTSYIPTTGVSVTRATEMGNVSWPTSGNISDTAGTVYLEWNPSVGQADTSSGTYGLVSVNGSANSVLYHQNTAFVKTFDGTNTTSKSLTWLPRTWYSLAATWGSGVLTTYVDGIASATTSYDGSFSPGAAFTLLTANAYPAHVANFKVWNSALTQTQIQNINSSGSTYVASVATTPEHVFVDSTSSTVLSPAQSLAKQTNVTNVNATPGSWYYDSGTSQLYIHLSDNSNPSGHTIEAEVRDYGIYSANHSFITLDNLAISQVGARGAYFENTLAPSGTSGTYYNNNFNEYNTVQYTDVWNYGASSAYSGGIYVQGRTTGTPPQLRGWQILHNSIGQMDAAAVLDYDKGGIELRGTTGALITYNTVATKNNFGITVRDGLGGQTCSSPQISYNAMGANQGSISISSCDNAIVTYNNIANSSGYGIGVGLSNGVVIAYNLLHDIAISDDGVLYNGIDINSSSNNGFMYNNTISNVAVTSATLESSGGASNGWTIKNNIFDCRNNAVVSGTGFCFYIDSGVTSYTFGNNLYYAASGNQAHQFEHPLGVGINFNSFETLVSENNGLNTDPLFVNPGSNFSLQSSSPAINAGANLGNSFKNGLLASAVWPLSVDIGDQSLSEGLWDIGAYVYPNNTVIPPASGGGGGGGGVITGLIPNAIAPTLGQGITTVSTGQLSTEELQNLIVALSNRLKLLQAQYASQNTPTSIPNTSSSSSLVFNRNLSLWMTGQDVVRLQKYLNQHGYPITHSGPGSLNQETIQFGLLTYTALKKFQASVGLPDTGYFGPQTREYVTHH